MNPVIIKEWWLASWEMKLIMIAAFIETTTGGMIAPYIEWIPGTAIEGYIVEYWHLIVLALVFALRGFKTSSKLTLFKKDATPQAEVIAAKAALKPKTEIELLREQVELLKAGQPGAAESPKA